MGEPRLLQEIIVMDKALAELDADTDEVFYDFPNYTCGSGGVEIPKDIGDFLHYAIVKPRLVHSLIFWIGATPAVCWNVSNVRDPSLRISFGRIPIFTCPNTTLRLTWDPSVQMRPIWTASVISCKQRQSWIVTPREFTLVNGLAVRVCMGSMAIPRYIKRDTIDMSPQQQSMSEIDAAAMTADAFRAFVRRTVVGQESAMYRIYGCDPDNRAKILAILINGTIGYFNDAYRALIRKDDPYFVLEFLKMCTPMQHAEICMLNLTCVAVVSLHTKLDVSEIEDTHTRESFLDGVKTQIDAQLDDMDLDTQFSHECLGNTPIDECDPDQDLFYASSKTFSE